MARSILGSLFRSLFYLPINRLKPTLMDGLVWFEFDQRFDLMFGLRQIAYKQRDSGGLFALVGVVGGDGDGSEGLGDCMVGLGLVLRSGE